MHEKVKYIIFWALQTYLILIDSNRNNWTTSPNGRFIKFEGMPVWGLTLSKS